MFKMFFLSVVFLTLSATGSSVQDPETDAGLRVEGTIESVYGSPIRLTNASYRIVEPDSKPKRLQVVGHGVTVENISGRRIRRLYLQSTFTHGVGGSIAGIDTVDGLDAGEVRVEARTNFRMNWLAERNDLELTVRATGAEFEDGSHWAAPRVVLHPLDSATVCQPSSHLIIRRVSWVNDAYKAVLEIGQEKVVAYRLGVVTDTPNNFEVRLGTWIDLNEADGRQFTDEAASLSPDRLFPRERYTYLARNGKEITNLGGVAIFVAELRFANGRTWRQDTSRDALLWCN